MRYDLLTIGDSAIDQFLKIHDATLHCDLNHKECEISFKYAEKIPVEEFKTSASGNAVNVAVGTATMGLVTQIYSEIGDDIGADLIIKTLRDHKVNTDFVFKNKDTATDIHPIIVFQGERTIFTYHATRNYKIRGWPECKFIYYTSVGESYKHFQPEILNYMQQHPDTILAFNPGSAQLKHDPKSMVDILKRTDVIFVNKEEAQIITGKKEEIRSLHKELTVRGVKLSVITDSLNGASVFDGKEYFEIGICEVGETQDKTGAGDAFASGFLSALKYGKSSEEALKWGTINSAKVITVPGSTNGLASKLDIENLITKVVFSKPNL
jgi:sugar/nucleoside kinase (ribokinase family)